MTKLPPEFFRRLDERPDELFYKSPQPAEHLDSRAAARAHELYSRLLPRGGRILDLMAGEDSHLDDRYREVTGLGLNLEELNSNPRITRPVLFDLNRNSRLPFADGYFDGAVCTASVQYMTRPGDTFREVARCLKPGAPFVITFSIRMFPSKAVLAWRASDDAAHLRLVSSYFRSAGSFTQVQRDNFVPDEGDPLYALWAWRDRVPQGALRGRQVE